MTTRFEYLHTESNRFEDIRGEGETPASERVVDSDTGRVYIVNDYTRRGYSETEINKVGDGERDVLHEGDSRVIGDVRVTNLGDTEPTSTIAELRSLY